MHLSVSHHGFSAGAPVGPETVSNDAGYIPVGHARAKRLFYWYFESRYVYCIRL